MRHRQVLIAVLFALSVGFPSSVSAAWPFHTASGVLLGYGQSYARDGADAVHRGVDIGAPAGSSVYAPAAGEVSFAGLVPGGSRQVFAVSVKTCEGLTVTCMPFDSVAVSTGEDISVGSLLGALAGDGDLSSSQSHVHVSVRREQAYLDPTSVLGQMPVAQGEATMPGSQPQLDAPDEPIRAEVPAPVAHSAVSPAVSPAAQSPESIGAVATTSNQTEVTLSPGTPGLRVASPADGVSPLASMTGVEPTTLNIDSPTVTALRNVSSQTEVSPGVWRALARIARSGDSRRSALVATGGCLVAVMGLWPLWRKGGNPAFSYGVRPTLDDVAAAVGR